MSRNLIAVVATLAALGLVGHVRGLHERLYELECEPRTHPAQVVRLERELERSGELASARLEDEARARADLARRLEAIARAAADAAGAATGLGRRIESWERRWSELEPDEVRAQLEHLRGDLDERARALVDLAEGVERLRGEGAAKVDALAERVEGLGRGPDVDGMWRELVGPVVQLAGDATVGSGVLLESRQREDGTWLTYLLTSWHVVRDIYDSPDRTDEPVPVRIYLPEGGLRSETARMVAYDVPLDVALLTLECDEPVPCGARLASRERVGAVRIFDAIYAVGCPLGNDPIPTAGEVAATAHAVDGARYWMISAPTYIGNSGGGIFDAGTHELIGIFSKIYTHGAVRSTIVPHMGLVTPLSIVYDWLDLVGQSQVVDYQPPAGVQSGVQTASATRE